MELLGATLSKIETIVTELGQPAYRAKQLADWIYKKGAPDFAAMTNLSAEFRLRLGECCALSRSQVITRSPSPDGTTKFLLEERDGERIEAVLLPYSERVTVCVSTQVGCAAGCKFCATATGGFVRNLTAGEIVDQVLTLQAEGGRRVTNVVFMGMGEPLLNYDEVLSAIRLLNTQVGIAMRKMTISTVGITPMIHRLQDENLQLTLAISLHAADDETRREIIPIAAKYSIPALVAACRNYANVTGRRVTYEYLLLAGENDSAVDAMRLAKLLIGTLCNVNLIPYNSVYGKAYKRPSASTVNAFRAVLEEYGIEVTQRFERGHSISAACGQLRAASD